MNKNDLGNLLAKTLHTDVNNGKRLAHKLQILSRKLRVNMMRGADGQPVAAQIKRTEGQIADICNPLAIPYKIKRDYRGPVLRLMLGQEHSGSIIGGTIVDDNL